MRRDEWNTYEAWQAQCVLPLQLEQTMCKTSSCHRHQTPNAVCRGGEWATEGKRERILIWFVYAKKSDRRIFFLCNAPEQMNIRKFKFMLHIHWDIGNRIVFFRSNFEASFSVVYFISRMCNYACSHSPTNSLYIVFASDFAIVNKTANNKTVECTALLSWRCLCVCAVVPFCIQCNSHQTEFDVMLCCCIAIRIHFRWTFSVLSILLCRCYFHSAWHRIQFAHFFFHLLVSFLDPRSSSVVVDVASFLWGIIFRRGSLPRERLIRGTWWWERISTEISNYCCR